MAEDILKRVLPHSIEAEQSLIGSMLMDRDAILSASEILTADDFYQNQNAVMFETILELFNEGRAVDLVTLQDRLREKDVPPEVSSLDFVRDLITMVPTSTNAGEYAAIVKEKSVLRQLIKTTEEIANECYQANRPLEEILQETEKRVFDLLQTRGASEFTPIHDIALEVLEKIEEAAKNPGAVTGIPTGFIDLDYKTSGLQPSDFVLIAARPSMGKTAFVLNLIENVAIRKGMPCMIFSLEMSKEQLVNRLISMESNVDAQKMRNGTLNDEEWDAVIEALGTVSRANLIIDDTPGITVAEVRSKCRKAKLEHGLSLIVIDYLQLMSGSGRSNDNRQQEISEISRSLKALAREMNAPVVTLSQLSRACEARADHRPLLSDLRESGAIEQDADLVMFLYRDDYYNRDSDRPNIAEVNIAKQRNGPIGTIELLWRPEVTKFANLARTDQRTEDR